MFPLPENVQRSRYWLLLIGLYSALFIAGMMTLGSLTLSETALRWSRMGVTAASFIIAQFFLKGLMKKGKPAWLFKAPPVA